MDLAEFIKEVGGGPSCAVGFMGGGYIINARLMAAMIRRQRPANAKH
jgi:hypothetical protein